MKPKIEIDTRAFNATFAEYAALSKRTLAENINQKSYSICLSAFGGTKKATPAEIKAYLARGSDVAPGAPIAAVLVNARRRAKGLKGLYGAEMKAAVAEYVKKQSARTNFLRAGWFSAIGEFARKIGKTLGKSAQRMSQKQGATGGATVAQPGISPSATFWNTSFAQKTTTKEGVRIASDGLAKAFAKQMADMRTYIARKREEDFKRIARRFMRL